MTKRVRLISAAGEQVKYEVVDDDGETTATSVISPSLPVSAAPPSAIAMQGHKHSEYAPAHDHPFAAEQTVAVLTAQVAALQSALTAAREDAANRVQELANATQVVLDRLGTGLKAEAAAREQAIREHAHLDFAPKIHPHPLIENRLRGIEDAMQQYLEHSHPHAHEQYVTHSTVESGMAEARRRDDVMEKALRDYVPPLVKHAHPDYLTKDYVPEIPLHTHEGGKARKLNLKDEKAKFVRLFEGHDLHIQGRVDVHGRGPEILYRCECGFTVMATELDK